MSQTIQGQPHDRYALILYGSETGNSQDAAERLGQITSRLHFKTIVTEMDDFADVVEKKMKSGEVKQVPTLRIESIRKATLVVLVTSTTGQGEFPKNSRRLWTSLLKKNLSPTCLEGVTFTTFGLGDSSYAKFNRAARLLHVRMQGLGAKELFSRGEADEQHSDGIDGAFLPWSTEFQAHIQSSYPLPEGVKPIPLDVLLPFRWTHQIAEPETEPKSEPKLESKSENSTASPTTTITSPTSQIPDPPTPEADDMKLYAPEDRTPDVPCSMLKDSFSTEDLKTDPIIPKKKLFLPPIPQGHFAYLQANRRVTPKYHWQDVREITFYVPGQINYQPGDTVTIYPQNFPEDVQSLIDLMDWNDIADKPLRFQEENVPNVYDEFLLRPGPKEFYPLSTSSLRQLLTLNLDITAIPQRSVFEILAHFTDDDTHKERLVEFSNPAYTDEFFDYATRPRRGILEILQDFDSVKLPFNIVTSVFPVMRGRPYSIASGGVQRSVSRKYTRVTLLVAIVQYKTVLQKVRRGLCTRYLAALKEYNSLIILKFDQQPNFYDPITIKPERPLILVAPGTGLAPCRSLIWERRELPFHGFPDFGRAYLFFGGRNETADYFYRDEWEENPNLKVTVFTAFSRDDPTGKKVYVQDRIREQGELIVRLLREEKAYIYVCGSSGSMPKAVREAFVDVVEEWSPDIEGRVVAEKAIENMERLGTYKQETW